MPKRKSQHPSITWSTVRKLGLALPDTEESTSYGTPALKVLGKLFVRLREEGDILVVRIDLADRSRRMAAAPDVFFITEHYEPFPYVLVRLKAIMKEDLAEVLQDAWRLVAPSLPPNGHEVPRPKKRPGRKTRRA
jgi:hypothetical protein